MTRVANGELSHTAHAQIAKLLQLHHQTHPKRIGERFHLTADYVRKIWTDLPTEQQAQLEDVLGWLR